METGAGRKKKESLTVLVTIVSILDSVTAKVQKGPKVSFAMENLVFCKYLSCDIESNAL